MLFFNVTSLILPPSIPPPSPFPVCALVLIRYVPYVGDSKRAMDEYTSEMLMGGRNTIVLHNTCEDSLLAAPLMLDLVANNEIERKRTRAKSRPRAKSHPLCLVGADLKNSHLLTSFSLFFFLFSPYLQVLLSELCERIKYRMPGTEFECFHPVLSILRSAGQIADSSNLSHLLFIFFLFPPFFQPAI